MVGRWFGNMAHGQFVQVAMSEAVPVKGELARPRHVRDQTATRPVLADSGVRESNTSFGGGGHDGSELDPNGSTGDRSRHWPGHPAPGHARHGVGDRHYSMYACRGTL